ncbi:MAG: hypothetical protein R6W69_12775 [Anaerolineales bacterium]
MLYIVRRVWNFTLDGVAHQVVLQRKHFAPYEILHNGKQVYKGEPSWLVLNLNYVFQVEGHEFEVGAAPGPYLTDYVLRVDGNLVYLNKSQEKKFSKNIAENLEDQSNWEKIATTLGLEYHPHLESDYAFRHRIVGYFSKFPVVAGIGFRPGGNTSGFVIVIQHNLLDDEKIVNIKKSDTIKKFLKAAGTNQSYLEITPNFTSLFVPFQGAVAEMGKSTVIQDFLETVTPYLYHPREKCQGNDCKNPFSKLLDFVIVNGSPWLMCPDCIAEISNVHKKMEQEYKQASQNLGRGMLYGALTAIAGAILLALAMIFFDRLVGFVVVFMVIFVFVAMDKAKTKRTLISMFFVALISVLGTIIGLYFGMVGHLLKEQKIILNLGELWKVFLSLLQSRMLLFIIIGNLSLTAIFGYTGLQSQRQQLRKIFNPKVEVIKSLNRPE